MSDFRQKILTVEGKKLSAATLNGDNITFTKIVMGNGAYVGDIENVTDIVSPKNVLNIENATTRDNIVVLTTKLLPGDITEDYDWSEIGVYTKGTDDVEVLYMYGFATDTSRIVKNTLDEKIISVGVIVANAENVSVVIDDSIVYATQADITRHNTDTTAHQDIRNMVRNIDLTSVTNKVTLEGELTRTHINRVATDVAGHITTEVNRDINNTNTQFTTSNTNINNQHNTTRNHVTVEVANAKKDILNSLGNAGDLSGKKMQFEEIKITHPFDTWVTFKEFNYQKGGIAKIVPNTYEPSRALYIRLIVDSEIIIDNVLLSNVLGSSSTGYYGTQLEIPFQKNFTVQLYKDRGYGGVTETTTALNLLYYLNR